MVRFKTRKAIESKYGNAPGPIKLAHDLGVSLPTAYDLLGDGTSRERISLVLINKLCAGLGILPGDLFEYVTDRKPRARTEATS